MKKILFVLVIVGMVCSLAGCHFSYRSSSNLKKADALVQVMSSIANDAEEEVDFLMSLTPNLKETKSYEALGKINLKLQAENVEAYSFKKTVESIGAFSEEQKQRIIEPLNRVIEKTNEYLKEKLKEGDED